MTNVYLVESPLQLLSATEAKASFPATDSILIIRNSLNEKNNRQMAAICQLSAWTEVIMVHTLFYTFDSDIRLIHILRNLQRKNIGIDNVFVGEYRSWTHRLFHKNLDCQNRYLLDDGAATINVQKNLITAGKEYQSINSVKLFLLKAISLACGLDWKKVITPSLFTCFDLTAVGTQTIKKNEFAFVRQLLEEKPAMPNEIFFFGSHLSDNPALLGSGVISRANEIAYLQKIRAYYHKSGRSLVYIPHRSESQEKLDAIRQQCGLLVKEFDLPVEIEFINLATLPEGIASFYSTALYTVSRLHQFISVTAFRIPAAAINAVYAEGIGSVYSEYANAFHVVEIDDIN